MAKKTYCDGCGVEITEGNFSRCAGPQIPCHISDFDKQPGGFNSMMVKGHSKMIDGRIHSISGRTVGFDLCLPCSNAVYQAAMDKIREIKKQTKEQTMKDNCRRCDNTGFIPGHENIVYCNCDTGTIKLAAYNDVVRPKKEPIREEAANMIDESDKRILYSRSIKSIDDEIQKCKESPYYFATTYLSVNGKPFVPRLREDLFNGMFNDFLIKQQSNE